MLGRGVVVNYVCCRRKGSQKKSICHRRDDARFSECVFSVDETLVRKCSCLGRCVSPRRDVILQNALAIVGQESRSSMAPDGARSASPNMCLVLAKRNFLEKLVLGVDETIFDF